MAVVTFSNPRIKAEIPNYPLGGNKRGLCVFHVERKNEKWRVGRTTTGKTKYTTWSGQVAIVDGDDGRTYILQRSDMFGFITIYRSDFKCAEQAKNGLPYTCHESNDKEGFEQLCELIVKGGAYAMPDWFPV